MTTSSLKIDSLLSMVSLRLKEDNFLKWRYQLESVIEGHDLLGYFDGSVIPPPKFAILDEEAVTSEVTAAYKDWLKIDKALLSFLIATLSDDAIEYVIRSKTSRDAWLSLTDQYSTVLRARVNQLKTELQTAQKGGDSIDKFLLHIKHVKDQLAIANVQVSDDDFMISMLNGIPSEYDMMKTVFVARETSISFKDFRTQLLAVEQAAEARVSSLHSPMVAMISQPSPAVLNARAGLLPTPPFRSFSSYSRYSVQSRSSGSISHTGYGHFSGNCPFQRGGGFQASRASSVGYFKTSVAPECQIYQKRGHTAVNCYHRNPSLQNSISPSASVIEC